MSKKKPQPLFAGHPYLTKREYDGRHKVYRDGIRWYAADDPDKVGFTDKETAILHAKDVQKRRGDAQSENP